MSFTVIFYVHHHGSGHLMRTLQVVALLKDYKVVLMGSNLGPTSNLPKNVSCVHLPYDLPDAHEQPIATAVTTLGFHYAPLGLKGIRDRGLLITEVLQQNYPAILVVDVSVEVSLLARLLGIPTISIRQHGKRDDLPHLLAYHSAEVLIAPFSESMYTGDQDVLYKKTIFTGGFSRFDGKAFNTNEDQNTICIFVGQGGTSISADVIKYIASCCPTYHFHVLGQLSGDNLVAENITFHGRLEEPGHLISKACMVIGNTGQNTVMEVASINKRFIGIPEPRPFDEQVDKAQAIQSREGVLIVSASDLLNTDWKAIINRVAIQQPDWQDVINPLGPSLFANEIVSTARRLFECH